MVLQSIKFNAETCELEIIDQLLLPDRTAYIKIKGVEDGWSVINKMQASCHLLPDVNIVLRDVAHFASISDFWLVFRFVARQRLRLSAVSRLPSRSTRRSSKTRRR